jgi:glycosyltransferase involved in cell wall biosynthesis
MSRKNRSIAIIGVYPPPLGGISVHIERLCHVLENRGVPFIVIDGSGKPPDAPVGFPIISVPAEQIERWCLRYVFRRNEKIVFNHFLRWKVRFFVSLLKLKGVKVVHTVHSYRSDGKYSLLERMMIKLTGALSDHFIAVTDEIKERLVRVGIPSRKISVIPAFIPPDETREKPVIPEQVRTFFERHERVIVANGGIGNEYAGADLYGADMCVESFIRLARKHPELGFLFCITHIVNENTLAQYQRRLEQAGLADRFCWIHEKMPLYPLLRQAALFVRPTASDGDALSIREALHYGTPVVASDAAKRPEGVITFATRDLDDFTAKCELVLSGATDRGTGPFPQTPLPSEQAQYADRIIDILLGRH